jgi:hypothetical protein
LDVALTEWKAGPLLYAHEIKSSLLCKLIEMLTALSFSKDLTWRPTNLPSRQSRRQACYVNNSIAPAVYTDHHVIRVRLS